MKFDDARHLGYSLCAEPDLCSFGGFGVLQRGSQGTQGIEREIVFWLPTSGNHAQGCDPERLSRAEAYMAVVLLVQKGHFHVVIDKESGGFRLDEFLDNRDGKGEFWAGRLGPVHYHGIWLDEETARNFLARLAPQQHRTATPQFE
jgi:hypothetical protein